MLIRAAEIAKLDKFLPCRVTVNPSLSILAKRLVPQQRKPEEIVVRRDTQSTIKIWGCHFY